MADQLRRRIESGQATEPLLRKHDLTPVFTSRGLGLRPMTPRPDRIPLTWEALQSTYDLQEPEPVLAEYTLLKSVRLSPIPWE